MLEDRDYMRQPAYNDGPSFSRLLNWHNWSWTVVVVVVNVLVFLVECAVSPRPLALSPDNVSTYYGFVALSLTGLEHGYLWQLFTYQFMHASVMHIFFNCWALYVFGRFLEDLLGGKRFLTLLLASGVVGGLVQVGTAFFWPQYFDGPVVGASAGVFGLVAAFAALFPERELTLLLFFVIPVTLRAKNLLLFSALLAIAGMVSAIFSQYWFGVHVANAAHLGGMLAGLMYVRLFIVRRQFSGAEWDSPPPVRYAEAAPVKSPAFWRAKPAKPEIELSADELLKTQVDPILDKISAHGLHSLTAREREILEKASGKLAKR